MSNELKDIACKLCPYDTLSEGWAIVSAEKLTDGNWRLEIQRVAKEENREAEEK